MLEDFRFHVVDDFRLLRSCMGVRLFNVVEEVTFESIQQHFDQTVNLVR
jgi:hypothetical protein